MPSDQKPSSQFCDGLTRRSFVRMGSLAVGGIGLADLLRNESQAGAAAKRHKSVIMVYLTGGIGHQDTFDLKPQAPAEIRGEFNQIATAVPGTAFCEHLPKLSACADKFTILRSIVGQRDEHSSFQSVVGFSMGETKRGNLPHYC